VTLLEQVGHGSRTMWVGRGSRTKCLDFDGNLCRDFETGIFKKRFVYMFI